MATFAICKVIPSIRTDVTSCHRNNASKYLFSDKSVLKLKNIFLILLMKKYLEKFKFPSSHSNSIHSLSLNIPLIVKFSAKKRLEKLNGQV